MKPGKYFILVVGPIDAANADPSRFQSIRSVVRSQLPEVENIWAGAGADEKVANRVMNAWNKEKDQPIADIDAPCPGIDHPEPVEPSAGSVAKA